jgi:hypothetical protein
MICCPNYPACRCALRNEATAMIRAGVFDQMQKRKAFDFTPVDWLYLRTMGIEDPDNGKETE